MATIIASAPGVVAALTDPTVPGNIQTLNVPGLSFNSVQSIITRIHLSEQCNVQFLHTLGDFIYIYTFGDRIGNLGISGLCFQGDCNSNGGPLGVEQMIKFYQANKLSKKASPLKITLGVSTTVQAFLMGFNCDVVDPQAKIYQFDLQLASIPG